VRKQLEYLLEREECPILGWQDFLLALLEATYALTEHHYRGYACNVADFAYQSVTKDEVEHTRLIKLTAAMKRKERTGKRLSDRDMKVAEDRIPVCQEEARFQNECYRIIVAGATLGAKEIDDM
jgi:hypothetical protein